jgi:FKBP-type peptidyl-prolyl cis-trans isomerase 2
MIDNGKMVFIEYTLKLDDGTTADSNVGGEPLVFEQGAHQILPALEAALLGLRIDDTKQVSLSPEEGYGPIDSEAFREVELEAVPEDGRTVGMLLMTQDQMGNERPVRVHELREKTIVLDLNHPLAGENLNFDVRVLGIE